MVLMTDNEDDGSVVRTDVRRGEHTQEDVPERDTEQGEATLSLGLVMENSVTILQDT